MIEVDARPIIGKYVFLSKYSQTKNGKKETWEEAVERVMNMHKDFYKYKVLPEYREEFYGLLEKAKRLYLDKRVLGAQRALQYGGELMLEKHSRFYNCCASYVDRVEIFEEIMFLLLCGCGVGFSVQSEHVDKLPVPEGFDTTRPKETFVVPDSIEGWAAAVGKLMTAYYRGEPDVTFDYSLIRPKGAPIRGGFKAPGHKPLKIAIEKVHQIITGIHGRKLRPFELHYILCIFANSVVTGGVRRSAMISMFDADDEEMATCKTGSWMQTMPELCRSNNSAVILPNTSKEKFDKIFECTKKFGEPGFIFSNNVDYLYNPCCEVGLYPKITDENGKCHTGFGFCNLSEINGGKVKTEDEFYEACEAAAILGTLQAGYTNFKVISEWSKKIAERDALIGVGITGLCENPEILFNPYIQRAGAKIVKKTNQRLAQIIGINPAARTTVIKPSGNSSQLLGTLSGITPGHAKHYIRHIQANDAEVAIKEWEKVNPFCIEPSHWSPETEKVIAFPVTLSSNSILRKKLSAIGFLQLVLTTKLNWIEEGTNFEHPSTLENPTLRMNVSNTCTVNPDEWDDVREFLWANKGQFTGVSLLSSYGDLDYPQAPFTEVLNETELAEKYGAGAILSSGLVVDGAKVFKDIWEACSAAMGEAPNLLEMTDDEISRFIVNHIHDGRFIVDIDGICISDVNCVIDYLKRKVELRRDWVRRFNSFADKYMGGDRQKTAYCLKHVNSYHKWQNICRLQEVDYTAIEWEDKMKEAGSEVATACAGGSCLLEEYQHVKE